MVMEQRVLIVDDSPSVLKILNDALRGEYQVSVATNGEDALAIAAAQNPDLLLLDIKMPGMDGYEVCRRLKQSPVTRDIPILFVTVLNDIEDETKGLEMGAVDYITKPISPAVVQSRVRTHLRLKRHQDHLEELVRERTRELAESRTRAEQANRAKSEFIVNISHELRSPMNSILGMTDLVLESELAPRQRECLEIAADSATHLLGLLNELLDFSGFETGRLALDSLALDPHRIFVPLLTEFREKAATKGLSFNWRIDPNIPAPLLGDPTRLRQVLTGLLDNALKFTPTGGIELEWVLEDAAPPAEAAEGGVMLRCVVTDTGIGIAAEHRERIFEPFSQVDGSLSRAHGGAGLGLAMTRKLVEMMGGRIRMESESGRGSRFEFTVRLLRHEAGAKTSAAGKSWNGLRVLVVEDILANRRLFQIVLENQGCRVRGVENGRLALAALEKDPFDLILMDIQMPEMDGLEATRLIRGATDGRWNPRIPIIALTAHAQNGDRQKFLDAGMDDYLAKPFRAKTLLDKVERLLMTRVTPDGDSGE